MQKSALTKIIAPVLAVCVLVGVYLPSSAAGSMVDGISYKGKTLEEMFSYGQSGDPSDLEIYPGEEVRIPLTADMFTFKDGKVPIKMETITLNQLQKVKVRTKIRAGSKALDYVQLDRDTFSGKPFISGTKPSGYTAYISVMFAKEFPSIEDQEFEFEIYMMVNKKTYEDMSITLSGSLMTDVIQVGGEDYDYVDLSNGIVMEMLETHRNAEIDVGHGIRLVAPLYKGQKYYGNVKMLEAKSAVIDELNVFKTDEELPELYNDIMCVYRMDMVGFGRTIKHVKFQEDQEMHIYGEELTYLGTTADEIPFSNYYFMAYERIPQLETESAYAEEPGYAQPGGSVRRPSYDESPVSGGDDEDETDAEEADEDETDEDDADAAPVKVEKEEESASDKLEEDSDAEESEEQPQRNTPRNNWADELA